jgi:hypothetical protein
MAAKLHFMYGSRVNVMEAGPMRYTRGVQSAVYADPLEAILRVARGRPDRLLQADTPGMVTAAAELRLAARVDPPAAVLADAEVGAVFAAAQQRVLAEPQLAGSTPGDSPSDNTPSGSGSSSSTTDSNSSSSQGGSSSSSSSSNPSALRWPLDPANVSTFLAQVRSWPLGRHHFLLEACDHSR